MSTEKQGPYHIEERPGPHGKLVRVQAHKTFTPRISTSLPVSRNGAMYELPAFNLSSGEKLILSMVEEDGVIVEGGGAA